MAPNIGTAGAALNDWCPRSITNGRPPEAAASQLVTWTAGIHPEYVEVALTWAPAASLRSSTRSTQPEIHVRSARTAIPSTRPPELEDTGGRVERFRRRAAKRSVASPTLGSRPRPGADRLD